MAEKEDKIKKSSEPGNTYKATKLYKIFVSNHGLLDPDDHKKLLKGESVKLTTGDGLSDVPEKQMRYLITNKLIEGV